MNRWSKCEKDVRAGDISGVAHAVQSTRLHGSYENSKGGGREVGEVGSNSDPGRGT